MSEDDPQPVNPYEPPVAIAQQSAAGGSLRRRWVRLRHDEQQLAQVVYRPADRGGVILVWTNQRVVARTRGLVGFARLAVPVTRVSNVEVRRAPSAAAWIFSAGLVFLAVWVMVLGALVGEFGFQLFAAIALISTALTFVSKAQRRHQLRIHHADGVFRWRHRLFLGFDRRPVEQGMKKVLQAARAAKIPVNSPPGFEDAEADEGS